MKKQTVEFTVQLKLCSSCGMCKAACPKKCISWIKNNAMYYPQVNHDKCISCGICSKICPGLGHDFQSEYLSAEDAVRGEFLNAFNAWSRDEKVRHASASGGVISSLVKDLLMRGAYDAAFMLDGYDYKNQLRTRAVHAHDLKDISQTKFPKSRYLAVSHEHLAEYVCSHRNEKVIFIGTSCAVRGFLNIIEHFKLNRENYLILGLFCDRIFNYNVVDYYSRPEFCGERTLEELNFKNKDSGGWPGNMKFSFSDGSFSYQDKTEREKIKDYFMPERCLYCIDKLNVNADISLGDNYTNQDSSSLGSNSVIIRTKRGEAAFNSSLENMEINAVTAERIMQAQSVSWRLNNLCFAHLKEQEIKKMTGETLILNGNVKSDRKYGEYKAKWKRSLEMLHAGEIYDNSPECLDKQMEKTARLKKNNRTLGFISRVYHAIKRRLG